MVSCGQCGQFCGNSAVNSVVMTTEKTTKCGVFQNIPLQEREWQCGKYLAIVDFQPIHKNEEDHALTFQSCPKPFKEKYDSMKGRMSSKFYDKTLAPEPTTMIKRRTFPWGTGKCSLNE